MTPQNPRRSRARPAPVQTGAGTHPHDPATRPHSILARIRRRRESIGQIDLREETLRTLRNAGRP